MKKHIVKIITIGYGYSDVLASNPNFLNHYNFNGLNILKLFKNIKKINMEFKPDIYHFFDDVTYNVLRFYIGLNKNKVILSKCGGPNIEWPYVNNLILFHRENYDWYKNIPKFKDVHIHLIPNRVQKLEINDLFQPIPKDTNSFNFVRICRIGIGYKKSIEDSINLVFYLHKKGFNKTKLYIIGTVENQSVYNEINKEIKNRPGVVTILTEDQYTLEASRMLYLADAAIGTGRGFMEVSSLGIPVLTINAYDNYPLLVTESNFEDVFKTNFSARNRMEKFDSNENLLNIERMIYEKNFYAHLSNFSLERYNKYFNVVKVLQEYTEVYENAKLGPDRYLRDIRSILRSFKSFYLSYKLLKNY